MNENSHISYDTVEFVFIRHGETEWNLENRMQGQLDAPLTEKGRRQADALAARLSRAGLTALYSSDLGRAWQTALPIAAATGLKPIAAPSWRERHLGIFQGLDPETLQKTYPREWATFMSWNPAWRIPEGESSIDLRDRLEVAARESGTRHPGSRIGIVTHGGVLDMLMRMALGIPLDEHRRYSLFNASLNTFTWRRGAWRLGTWGDIGHLLEIGSGDNRSVAARSL